MSNSAQVQAKTYKDDVFKEANLIVEKSNASQKTNWSLKGMKLSTNFAEKLATKVTDKMVEGRFLGEDWSTKGMSDNEFKLFRAAMKFGIRGSEHLDFFFEQVNGKSADNALLSIWDNTNNTSALVDADNTIGEKSGSKRWWRDIFREIVGEVKKEEPVQAASATFLSNTYSDVKQWKADPRVDNALKILGIVELDEKDLNSFVNGGKYSVGLIETKARSELIKIKEDSKLRGKLETVAPKSEWQLRALLLNDPEIRAAIYHTNTATEVPTRTLEDVKRIIGNLRDDKGNAKQDLVVDGSISKENVLEEINGQSVQ